jgi:hypothetical protein
VNDFFFDNVTIQLYMTFIFSLKKEKGEGVRNYLVFLPFPEIAHLG